MDQSTAADLGGEVRNFYEALPASERPEGRESVQWAFFSYVDEFVHPKAVVAMIEQGGPPMLLAYYEGQLQVIEVDPTEDIDHLPVTGRMIHVEPGAGTVKIEARYRRPQFSGGVTPRGSTWEFRFKDGTEFSIPTRLSQRGDIEPREALCRALAGGLGLRADFAADNPDYSEQRIELL